MLQAHAIRLLFKAFYNPHDISKNEEGEVLMSIMLLIAIFFS